MDPTIDDIKINFYDSFEWNVQIAETCWKRGLPFLLPSSVRKCTNTTSSMDLHPGLSQLTHQYTLLPTTPTGPNNSINTHYQPNPPPLNQHPYPSLTPFSSYLKSHILPTNRITYSNFSLDFKKRGTSQNYEYYPAQVTTTSEGVETITPPPPPEQDLHPNTNVLDVIANTFNTMTPSTSATTVSLTYILYHTPLFPRLLS